MKNEKGYALLLVLFLVMTIMIISTTFVSASVSNAKQGKTVDENNLAVVASEMGIDYYKAAFVNEFNKKKVELVNHAQIKVDELINSEEFLKSSKNEKAVKLAAKSDEIRQYFFNSLLEHFDPSNLSIHYPTSIGRDMYFERLLSYNVETTLGEGDLKGIKIEGVVTGHNERQKKDLDFDITFIVPKLNLGEVGDGAGGGNVGFGNLYPNPTPAGLSNCTADKSEKCIGDNNTSLQNKDGSTIYFPDGYSKGNGNLKFNTNHSELYVNSHFLVHNANNMNMSSSSLFVNGEFKVNQNSNNMNQSLIKVNGPFTVGQNMGNINDSTILVNGPFKVGQNMQNATGSKICVNGSFTVDGNLKPERTDIYVIGTFTVGDIINMNSSSHIYVYNPGWVLPSKYLGKITLLDSDTIIRENCGFGGTNPSLSLVDFDWDDNHEINVEY